MPDRPTDGGRPAILRAEDIYTPPPHLPADAFALLPPAERVLRWYEEKVQRRLPRPDAVLLQPVLHARIDSGRWIADCPCASAQAVTPADPRMYCVECLTGWYRLVFPDDVAAVEASLAHLPAHQRAWNPAGGA